MKDYCVSKIKNVALLGHGGSGKTSLAEAILYSCGATDRMGNVMSGNTVSDYDAEEIKRQCSISASILPVEWNDYKINIIDTPGFFDFIGEQYQGLRAVDAAVLVLSGKSGVTVGAEKSWEICRKHNIPLIIYINKLDDESSDFNRVVNELRDSFGKSVAPFLNPVKEGNEITGYINVVDFKTRKFEGDNVLDIETTDEMKAEVAPIREMIIESVAETDDDLMTKFFDGVEFTVDEIKSGLSAGIKSRAIVPVLCGSALKNQGTRLLLDAIVNYIPSADKGTSIIAVNKNDEPVEISPDPDKPVVAQIFKTIADPFIGRFSFVRVYQGTLKKDTTLINTNKDKEEKISKICIIRGKKQIDTDKLIAGDIGAIPKLSDTSTCDTLCDKSFQVILDTINFPAPVTSMAVMPKAKGDEEKISSGIHKIMDEDKTVAFKHNVETHEQVLSGIGEQHIEVVVSKLKAKYNVDVELKEPKVPYRETIRKSVKVEGKHKKQSGGHGQYGHVWIEFEPTEAEGLVFEENVFGGSVPKNFFPAVEKGLKESMEHGVLAGYPVVGLKATLYDGSYHSVDSSEMAFKMAANLAYKNGLPQAMPVLLEPIGALTVTVPNNYMGDIMGDINKRRGRVLGSDQQPDSTVLITADVPMAEMAKFATDLRSMTQGRGSFAFEFKAYEQAPDHIAKKIIEESKNE